jgi:integrase
MSERKAGFNWVLDPSKFLCLAEVMKLMEVARERANKAIARGGKIPVRDSFVVDLALSTGLRVMEITQLNCGDIFTGNGMSMLLVRNGSCTRQAITICVWYRNN